MTARFPAGLAVVAVLLAVAGASVAGYLAIVNLQGETGVCVGVHGCDTVQNSRYGKPFGIPISVPGLAAYVALIVLGWAWLKDLRERRDAIAFTGFLAALGGVLFSGYLTYIEAFVLDAWCSYCIVSALLMVALFAVWSGLLWVSLRDE